MVSLVNFDSGNHESKSVYPLTNSSESKRNELSASRMVLHVGSDRLKTVEYMFVRIRVYRVYEYNPRISRMGVRNDRITHELRG